MSKLTFIFMSPELASLFQSYARIEWLRDEVNES